MGVSVILVSETPFGEATLDDLLARNDLWHQYLDGGQATATLLEVAATGQYIRVQLAGTGVLSLAEVEVFGSTGQ